MKFDLLLDPRRKLWLVFAVCFVISQAINLWSIFPIYGGWHVLGFPLLFFRFQEGAGYVYFDVIYLLIDVLVWYVVARGIMFGYGQLTKYKILR